MRVTRVHVDAGFAPDAEVALDARAAHHLVRVLRLRAGDRVVLFDGRGHEADARLVKAHRRDGCVACIERVETVNRESPLEVELVQSLARGDRMDWVVQKAVELGVMTIRPVIAERSEVRPDARASQRKLERWREIAIGACEQSGRTRLPTVHAPVEPGGLAIDAPLRLVLQPDAGRSLRELDAPAGRVAVAVGPEGGFGPADLKRLAALEFIPFGLGPRVLRTETAGLAALAALQVLFGDLGRG